MYVPLWSIADSLVCFLQQWKLLKEALAKAVEEIRAAEREKALAEAKAKAEAAGEGGEAAGSKAEAEGDVVEPEGGGAEAGGEKAQAEGAKAEAVGDKAEAKLEKVHEELPDPADVAQRIEAAMYKQFGEGDVYSGFVLASPAIRAVNNSNLLLLAALRSSQA